MNPKICLYAPPFVEMTSHFEMVDFAVEHGIQNMEVMGIYELSDPDLEFAKKLRKYADEKGVKTICVTKGVNLIYEDRYEVVEQVKRYIDGAVILGAPYVHHTIAFEFSNPDIILENEELYFQRGIECVREIYEYARAQGVRTLCEEQGYLFNGIKGYSRFIDAVGVDVGTVADFGNIMQAGDVLEDFIPVFSDRIAHVHVKDYSVTSKHIRAKADGEHYTKNKDYLSEHPFGKGQVNFTAIMEQLKKASYTGYFSVECGMVSKNTPERYLHNLQFTDEILTEYGF